MFSQLLLVFKRFIKKCALAYSLLAQMATSYKDLFGSVVANPCTFSISKDQSRKVVKDLPNLTSVCLLEVRQCVHIHEGI